MKNRVMVNEVISSFADCFESNDPEKVRVESIVSGLLSHLVPDQELSYHFRECDGHDDEHYDWVTRDLPEDAKWYTVYNSCDFPVSDGGSYSIIEVARGKNNCFYLALSLGGSSFASALTEYFRVPLDGNWQYEFYTPTHNEFKGG